MAGSIDDIDFHIFIHNGCIFGKNRYAPFPLDIVGIHDAFGDLLIFPEYAALFQKLIDQRRFTVVNMGDYRNISDIFSCCIHEI
jgi:hypothetical protein